MTDRRVVIDVDARGRVSLARFGLKDTQIVVDPLPDGGLALHPAVALTPAEAAHYSDPSAQATLERGLKDASEGRLRATRLRSDLRNARSD
ncbi:MAG TPA: hypothetical protein VM848_18055 [Acidimicrobiia bacterium]|nr:hypothetical protein [Acidimicrobiia bacterium]